MPELSEAKKEADRELNARQLERMAADPKRAGKPEPLSTEEADELKQAMLDERARW